MTDIPSAHPNPMAGYNTLKHLSPLSTQGRRGKMSLLTSLFCVLAIALPATAADENSSQSPMTNPTNKTPLASPETEETSQAPSAEAPPQATNRSAIQRYSRLNKLIRRGPQLYLPPHLRLGQENQFVVRGTPGQHVTFYMSTSPTGFETPTGLPLRVGKEHETMNGIIPEKGVLKLMVELPDDETLEGRKVYLDAVLWGADDYSDLEQVEMVASSGRRTNNNQLVIAAPADPGSTMIMPSMPGLPANLMRNITNMSDAMSNNDERRKELLDTGARDDEALYDRNSFLNRQGGSSGLK